MDEARKKPLGFPSLFALGVNGIVGVGIFFAPAAVAAEVPGTAAAGVYVLTALALLPIALGYAALGSRFSVDGGPFVWADAAFGRRFAFLVGWVTYASALTSLAAVLAGLAHQASALFGISSGTGVHVLRVVLGLSLALIAASGLRLSAMVWTSVTVLKLLPLAALVIIGTLGTLAPAPAGPGGAAGDLHGILRAALVVVFALQGFEIVPLLAGSVHRSESSVPLATVGSLLFAAVLYAILHALSARALPDLAHSRAPLVDAARAYGGRSAAGVVALGANVSAVGIAFGMFNTTPRYLSALSKEGAFGPWIGELDGRFVPQRALWLTAIAVLVMVGIAEEPGELFVLSSLAVLAQFATALAALGVLAWRREYGLDRGRLVIVGLSVIGILLASHGAEAKELLAIVAVAAFGEALRRISAFRARTSAS